MTEGYSATTSIDGMRLRPVSIAHAPPQVQTRPKVQSTEQIRPSKRKRRGLPQWLQLSLAMPLFLIGAFAIQSPVMGQAAIACYGLVAWIWRIPSRTSFVLALIALLTTAFLLLFKGDVAFAQTFSIYTFLFLVAGVITLGRELKKEGGRIYSRRR